MTLGEIQVIVTCISEQEAREEQRYFRAARLAQASDASALEKYEQQLAKIAGD